MQSAVQKILGKWPALSMLFSRSERCLLSCRSFFQLGGIHGWPYVPYGYTSSGEPGGPGGLVGYCWHGSQLFPTWHRPYVALLEQVWGRLSCHQHLGNWSLLSPQAKRTHRLMQELCKCIINIADQYTGAHRTGYVAAASTFRLPYWDWLKEATSESGVPACFTDTQASTVDNQ